MDIERYRIRELEDRKGEITFKCLVPCLYKKERLEQIIKLHDGRDLHMLHSHTVPGTQEIVNKASGLNE